MYDPRYFTLMQRAALDELIAAPCDLAHYSSTTVKRLLEDQAILPLSDGLYRINNLPPDPALGDEQREAANAFARQLRELLNAAVLQHPDKRPSQIYRLLRDQHEGFLPYRYSVVLMTSTRKRRIQKRRIRRYYCHIVRDLLAQDNKLTNHQLLEHLVALDIHPNWRSLAIAAWQARRALGILPPQQHRAPRRDLRSSYLAIRQKICEVLAAKPKISAQTLYRICVVQREDYVFISFAEFNKLLQSVRNELKNVSNVV